MPSPLIPFFSQEKEWSCTVACLRMVMAYWGINFPNETALAECCKTTTYGTNADEAVACAKSNGLAAQHLHNCDWETLQKWITSKIYPITLINTYPLIAKWAAHAVVITHIEDQTVHYLDPARGSKTAFHLSFAQAWQMNRNRVILVQKR